MGNSAVKRIDYFDAAMDAIATVLPNDKPIRIVLQEILLVVFGCWIDDHEPMQTDLARLRAALERAVAAA
ncbi:MAG: hypothetical protein JO056_09335 [Alphaproteobacteria bacterium]|nr:hypothetical protein [Alphaproteobacteria bacterium]